MLDTLIRGAKIVDGTGKAAFTADVGILDGMIEAVGNLSGAQAFETIEAAGRVLTPGFIDMHRHADAALFREGFGEAELCQGLTTLVNGNCGMSLAPLSGAHADECAKYLAPITGNIPPELRFASIDSYFKAAQGRGLPLSCAELIGMGTLRTLAAGFAAGDLSPLELRDLHYHMEAALADGACGVSLGLGYAPEIFYSTDGLIRALAPLHRSGVPICVHMRQEGDGVVDALREMLEVARALQTPLEISHLKAIGGRNARKAVPEMLSLIERARQDGLNVMCDVYPYTAGSTQLIHVLPPEFQEGGTEALTKRLLDDAARKEMRARMEAGSDFENITLLVGFDNVIAIGLPMDEYRRFEGKSVAEIAQTLQKDPFDTLFDLLAAEAAYCAKEDELRRYLDTYEQTHDYDEYHYDLDEIEHDPYVLLSILSALHEGTFTIDQVQGDLQMLFDRQYILTETVEVERRYYIETDTWTDEEGNTHTESYRVYYDYYICTVKLENFDLSHLPVYMMDQETLSMYAVYMSTLGNRPDLFPSSPYVGKYTNKPPAHEIPEDYLADETFAAILKEAEKYVGYPYVWGGSSPSTSFDCSGFVSYVYNQCGWDFGRLGAQGLYNISARTSSPKPGDLVFFTGTYDTPGISHVGIYVGDGWMLHCGDPISYANLNTSYWQSHFYAYGKLF